jgi:RNA polymerase sigma-70 factor (ECF subfamily)
MIGVMTRPAAEIPGVEARREGFDEWMRAEQRRVFRICYRLLGTRDEADTATQEVFLKAYRALWSSGAAPLEEPAAWLTRVAVNTCLDRLRSRRWRFWRKWVDPESEALLQFRADDAPGPERQALAGEIAARLAEALSRLSERQRSVFVLRHYEDLSLDEVARVLALDVGTVKAHLNRAVVKLRKELRDLYFPKEVGI